MSHDTDKLIRQLSLVAFLMAERRPLTARDIKSNVEGYQEMSDEAFARRFYSDRAELVALGVPLDSQRDEFTGEELYTLRSERYFLPELELDDDELAALQTCFYLLEGRFAYAEPLRLALQNLALGRSAGGMAAPPTGTAGRVEVRDPDYSPELQGRLGKLEGAISKQRTVKFRYWSIYRDEEEERSLNPYALLPENGSWYVIGFDLERKDIRTFRVARIRSDIRFATRRERDFRLPPEFDVENYRGRAEWQFGDVVGEARVEVAPDTAWWVKRVYDGPRNRLEDDVFVTEYASLALLARWILRQDGRAIPLEPSELRRLVTEGARAARRAHEGPAAEPVAEIPREIADPLAERPAGPVAPERFGVLQSLLAYLLTACGDNPQADITAQELVDRFSIPRDQLEEHLSLLNLVNFGGGCYAVYAELRGDAVHVDKELFGDTFRRPPQADAARGARDPAGARVRRPDGRRRRPLPARPRAGEARGDLRRIRSGADALAAHRRRRGSRREADAGDRRAQARGDRVPEAGGAGGRDAHGRAVFDRAPAAVLVRPHVGHRARPGAVLSPRPDATRQGAAQDLPPARRLRPGRAARARAQRGSGTRRPWRGGKSRRARAGSSTARRSQTERSAAPTG